MTNDICRVHDGDPHPVCAQCPALAVALALDGLCPRCRLYAELDRATSTWSPEARSMLSGLIALVLTTHPPEDVGPFWRLVGEVSTWRH